MKLLTNTGNGPLVVPGEFTVAAGESHKIAEKAAKELVQANPGLPVTITDLPAKSRHRRRAAGVKSQPEAPEGEGQPPASTDQKE